MNANIDKVKSRIEILQRDLTIKLYAMSMTTVAIILAALKYFSSS